MTFPAINPALDRALAEQGYTQATPVQQAVLEADAAERDLLVSAQTGSGKTVAYALAFASTLMGEAERLPAPEAPLALIVAPTRELALQVHRELTWLYAHAGAKLVTCVGGMDSRREQRALEAGAHIVVGTPGRLRDHLERGNLDASALRVVVLDEADEMLDLGFREDLEFILDATPSERRTLLFSATIARDIAAMAKRYQRDAVRIDTIVANEPHGDITYKAVRVAPNEVEHAVVNILRAYEVQGAMVFCSTRESVRRLHANLQERGFGVVALSGELTQNERTRALQSLRDRRARVCVATDVAARGLDLPDLGLVIHAELPINSATLLHRSGRTGRAGRKGTSVLVVPYNRRRKAETLVAGAKVEVEWGGPPQADEIRRADQQRLLEDAIFTDEVADEELAAGQILLEGRTAEQVAVALLRLHRSRLPAPEDLFDAPPPEREFGERAPRETGPRPEMEGASWFRVNVGRRNNADPKWLIPLICRLGHVTKREIGSIRIFDNETKFEIAAPVVERFGQAVEGAAEGGAKIQPTNAPAPRSFRDGPREDRPRPERKFAERKPREEGEERPRPKRDFGAPRAEGERAYGKPRDRFEADERPRPKREFGADRAEGERSYERKPRERFEGEERPRPKRDFGAERGGEERPFAKRKYEDRPARDETAPRPKRDYSARAEGGERSYGERKPGRENGGYERPRREYGERPAAERKFGERPDWKKRDEGPRNERSGEDRPYKPRKAAEAKPARGEWSPFDRAEERPVKAHRKGQAPAGDWAGAPRKPKAVAKPKGKPVKKSNGAGKRAF
ncbi:DEAD/DEAH box helicase [Caulobacter sp. 17J80-11]|uniref:DEAD/DEAH box helicase n=1 Tax=Caulobacter sp. 17J80-11 TaxID=2763502 RepID=UPI0016539290|nr:DEAD/DEAH box helicase [Caulobacter sp. 17J80-11]MBC6983386.1 DEAD/DEAH box helicase [Caulobacter sp. 17J80-11]